MSAVALKTVPEPEGDIAAVPHCPTCGQAVPSMRAFIFDRSRGTVVRGTHQVQLSPKESDFFAILQDAYPTIVSRDGAIGILWPERDPRTRQVQKLLDVMVLHLRRKLDRLGLIIQLTWGIGYSLEVDLPETAAALRLAGTLVRGGGGRRLGGRS